MKKCWCAIFDAIKSFCNIFPDEDLETKAWFHYVQRLIHLPYRTLNSRPTVYIASVAFSSQLVKLLKLCKPRTWPCSVTSACDVSGKTALAMFTQMKQKNASSCVFFYNFQCKQYQATNTIHDSRLLVLDLLGMKGRNVLKIRLLGK